MYSDPFIAANQAYAGQAQLALQALTVPISRRVDKKIGIVNARKYLLRLCKTLEQRLLCPITVHTQGAVRMVTAFGVAGYMIDHARRVITGGRVNTRGKFSAIPSNVDIFHPLCTSHWIRWIIEDSGVLDQAGTQFDLFRSDNAEWFIQWLADKAYQILKATTVFRKIRKYDIPKAFALDSELLVISLKSRIDTHGTRLNNDLYSLIWKHEGDYRQVNQENPKLLPLLTACFLELRHNICLDPVQAMKNEIIRFGITEASWRYLTKHGARMFRYPWKLSQNESKLNVAIYYLLALQDAGLPPPPAISVVRTWLSPYVRGNSVPFDLNWSAIPNNVLHTLLIGAEENRDLLSLGSYCTIFHQIAEWSLEHDIQPDENQQRGGWRWLKHQYDLWKGREFYKNEYADISWDGILEEFDYFGHTFTPVTNAVDLYLEGELMHNCLRNYIHACSIGEYLVFSILDQKSGRHVAVIGIDIVDDGTSCQIGDVRGCANNPAKKLFWDIGNSIVNEVRRILEYRHSIVTVKAG